MAADVFPGFESAKTPETVSANSEQEKFGQDADPKLEVNRRLQEQRATAIEQKAIKQIETPGIHHGTGHPHIRK